MLTSHHTPHGFTGRGRWRRGACADVASGDLILGPAILTRHPAQHGRTRLGAWFTNTRFTPVAIHLVTMGTVLHTICKNKSISIFDHTATIAPFSLNLNFNESAFAKQTIAKDYTQNSHELIRNITGTCLHRSRGGWSLS